MGVPMNFEIWYLSNYATLYEILMRSLTHAINSRWSCTSEISLIMAINNHCLVKESIVCHENYIKSLWNATELFNLLMITKGSTSNHLGGAWCGFPRTIFFPVTLQTLFFSRTPSERFFFSNSFGPPAEKNNVQRVAEKKKSFAEIRTMPPPDD